MKILVKLVLVLFLVGFASCRDTSKEEAENKAALEEIEKAASTADEISEEVNENAEEVMESLKELDSI